MLRLASDADVNGAIVSGLRRRSLSLDLVRVQDVLPEGTPDPDVLVWCTANNRVLITNDRNTMVGFAYANLETGYPPPGLIVTRNDQEIGAAIEDILLIAECVSEEEMRERVVMYLPL